jgi:hypothetical protein
MKEALIVAALTFVGLIAWATLINIAVKALFDCLDRQAATPAPHPGPQALAQLGMGKEHV